MTVKSLRKNSRAPTCFVSYAWGVAEHEKWVLQLAKDLCNSGIRVVFDRWHNTPGTNIVKFIERIDSSDFVVVVGSLKYLEKWVTEKVDPVVDAEFRLIGNLLTKRTEVRERVVPLLLDGSQERSFPPLLRGTVYIDFQDQDLYFVHLFNLILTLYGIPFDSPAVEPLQESLRPVEA